VAKYSVHAIAGLKPDYGIHFPNIRSPEGWQKDNARFLGVIAKIKKPAFPERFSIWHCTDLSNNSNLRGRRLVILGNFTFDACY